MRTALRLVRAMTPKRVIAAAPARPPGTIPEIERKCDQVICLESLQSFGFAGRYYRVFDQASDATVIDILDRYTDKRPKLSSAELS